MRYRVLFVVLLGLLVCASVYADIPRLINFQGRLTDASGKFVSDGNYSLTFKIYSDSSGGSAKWSEAQSVAVSKGLFNVILGSQTPIPDSIFNYPNTWLGIQVGADPEMSPRQRLSSLGYAYRGAKSDTSSYSMNSDKLDGLHATDFASIGSDYGRSGVATDLYEGTSTLTSKYVNEGQASSVTSGMITDSSIVDADVSASAAIAGTKISPNFGSQNILTTGNVGIGTTAPNEQLEITGNLRLPASTASVGVIKSGPYRFIHTFGPNNFFAGVNAGNFTLSGTDNTGVGHYALFANTTGSYNTAVGPSALWNNTTGSYNTAVGTGALYYNTTGYQNMAMGRNALNYNTTGSYNTAVGPSALGSNTTGYFNTAMGFGALGSNTTGYYNTAVGDNALYSNTTGGNNTAMGRNALTSNTTGTYNTAIGYGANVSVGNLTNATAIGYGAIVGNAANAVRIGNTAVISIGGQVGWSTFSDGRYKKGISENVPGLAFISKLKPVTYTMDVDAIDAVLNASRKPGEGQAEDTFKMTAEDLASRQAQSQIVYTGFIAQEVEKAARETGYDFSGVDAPKNPQGMYGLRYAEFVVPLVKAVQEQQEIIKEQQKQIKMLEQRVAELEKK